MSVIVKGMKMPTNCSECPCLRHDSMDGVNAYQCNITLKSYDDNSQDMWTERDTDCPLVDANERRRDNKGRFEGKYIGDWECVDSLEGEMWAPIIGYESRYMVSNMGRVRNRVRVLTPFIKNNGYLHVMLSNGNDSSRKTFAVHRLVATAFVRNPNPGVLKIVNHIDENKKNNRSDNLEWCDLLYNLNYGTARKRNGEIRRELFSNRDNNWKCKGVKCIDTGRVWRSAKDVEDEIGIDASSILKCCHGKRKTAGGFKWIYITNAPTIIEKE